ncbi:DUF1835 domain-containing protein [Cesiribacter andamanensis]|uniref:DUF1835 domain-containing protein n=1 Tax=Cesiribacter andamanensis AMV16 TaxID=1279009 RepID=M7N5H9_9BACT|nr:DUF1835 domain-containing protein [Cesiribacter andamanensis]EMR03878.1 hypothetical protein ADICEAN_00935 [Cesiribacter andamanensis AMV16]
MTPAPQLHILTGDALLEAFPQEALPGKRLVFRECLIEGPLEISSEQTFWQERARFLQRAYGVAPQEYEQKTVQELRQVANTAPGSEINLWFEDDLFCQVNLWFLLSYLKARGVEKQLYKVFPLQKRGESPWAGFGWHSAEELQQCYARRLPLSSQELDLGIALWQAYARQDAAQLKALSSQPTAAFRQLPELIQAQLARNPEGGLPGLPQQQLLALQQEGYLDFPALLQEFSRRYPVWGFGDWQLKRLLVSLPPKGKEAGRI